MCARLVFVRGCNFFLRFVYLLPDTDLYVSVAEDRSEATDSVQLQHKFYIDFLRPQVAVQSPASTVLLHCERARFDRLTSAVRRETHIIVENLQANAGALTLSAVPWLTPDSDDARSTSPRSQERPGGTATAATTATTATGALVSLPRVLAPCPAKIMVITHVNSGNAADDAVVGGKAPQVFTVLLPDLQLRCQSKEFFCILDVFNNVVLANRPLNMDVGRSGMLYTPQLPSTALDQANAWRMRGRELQQLASDIAEEMATLYVTEEVPLHFSFCLGRNNRGRMSPWLCLARCRTESALFPC